MKLIKITNNLFVNVEEIRFVEQKTIRGKSFVIINVAGEIRKVETDLKEFFKELNASGSNLTDQFIAV